MKIRRPIWRSFTQKFLENAVAHVRRGGHAVVWRPTKTKPAAWLLLPCGNDGEMPELSFWSLLALEKERFDVVDAGLAKGLASMRVPRDLEWAVEEWCERDAKWPGSTRVVELDCLACGACCTRNRVVLTEEDFGRWRSAGRAELGKKPYVRGSKGEVVLRLASGGDCVHLNDKRCSIYELRPDNCSMFPAGSECCLSAREEELGLVD